jgi:hypothetical protein
MRFLLASIWLAAVVAVAPTLALGASDRARGYHSEAFTVPNFCGTGVAVEGFFESIFTASERDGVVKVEHQGSVTFSYDDASVIESFAGQFTHTLVSTGEDGTETRQLISKGIPVKIQLANGQVLARDAGMIVQLVIIQNGNEIDVQTVSTSGPHPIDASGGSLFCTVVPQALGIT